MIAADPPLLSRSRARSKRSTWSGWPWSTWRQSTRSRCSSTRNRRRCSSLKQRAIDWGWAASGCGDRPGPGAQRRDGPGTPGIQELLAQVSLDHVGVVGHEMSRLARSCRTGINSWNSALSLAHCWRIKMASTTRATTTTGLLGLKAP